MSLLICLFGLTICIYKKWPIFMTYVHACLYVCSYVCKNSLSDEARWSYSSLKWNIFTQFGSKTSSTLFLKSSPTILSAILQDYHMICKHKWQKCFKPLKTHIGPKMYAFLPQFGPKNYSIFSQHLLKWLAKDFAVKKIQNTNRAQTNLENLEKTAFCDTQGKPGKLREF